MKINVFGVDVSGAEGNVCFSPLPSSSAAHSYLPRPLDVTDPDGF